MSYNPNPSISFADGPSLDAFGRLRVADTHIRFSSNPAFDKLPYLWSEDITNVGTGVSSAFVPAEGLVRMTLGAGSPANDGVIRQQRWYNQYRSGHGNKISMTFTDRTTSAGNVRSRIGMFDASDGIYLESVGADTPWHFVLRSSVTGSVVNTTISQSSWNIDKLDGTGPSGLTLDQSKIQLLVFDYQYLGAGRLRMGFSIGGQIVYVHAINNANISATTYWRRGSLPLRVEIIATGTTSGSQVFDAICAEVSREGGADEPGYLASATTGTVGTSSTTERTLLSIRLRPDSGSLDYHAGFLKILDSTIHQTTGTSLGQWRIRRNPTFSAGSLTWVDNGLISQQSVTQLAVTGGELILGAGPFERGSVPGTFSTSLDSHSFFGVGWGRSGSDVISLTVQNQTGSESVLGNMSYLEII